MSFKNHVTEYAKKELKLTNFDKTNFGKSAITLLEDVADLSKNDPSTMKSLIGLLIRLVDLQPLAPITEDDFDNIEKDTDSNPPVSMCHRYPYIYRDKDGKYWNDRAVAFIDKKEPNNKMYLYQAVRNSKQEITLPYYPKEVIDYIDD